MEKLIIVFATLGHALLLFPLNPVATNHSRVKVCLTSIVTWPIYLYLERPLVTTQIPATDSVDVTLVFEDNRH